MGAQRTWTSKLSTNNESNYTEHTDWKKVMKDSALTQWVNDSNFVTHSSSAFICVHLRFYFPLLIYRMTGALRDPSMKRTRAARLAHICPAASGGLALVIVVPSGESDKIVYPKSDRKLGEIIVRVSSNGLAPAEVRLITQP